ncbi:MAG: SDR family NAD(P)-dependent oxidoreductase [Chloroflexi bacterium]|nr:SDR family NAD(P)-dependent oxidoreductase [Chloroflexota bacterium]
MITGAASGIGRAAAWRIARDGAHVVIVDINAEQGEQVAADLRKKFGYRRAHFVQADVTGKTPSSTRSARRSCSTAASTC